MTSHTAVPLRGIRRTIARRMTAAWQVPVFHLTAVIDMDAIDIRRSAPGGAFEHHMFQEVRDAGDFRAFVPGPGADEKAQSHRAGVRVGLAQKGQKNGIRIRIRDRSHRSAN